MKLWPSIVLALAAGPSIAANAASNGAGASIANQGLPNAGVAACSGCHGQRGEGNAGGGFPSLAGQSAAYLSKQLQAYADGSRNNPVMSPIAKALSPVQRQAVSAYFAGFVLPVSATAAPAVDQALAERGRILAVRGDDAIRVQACANCHGPDGIGEGPLVPGLAGQHNSYLVAALRAWRDGSRKTDPSGQMPGIAHQLSDADIDALASYYSGLPALRAAPSQAAKTAKPKSNTVPSGPRGAQGQSAGQAPQGVGTEQGAPTTGGAQGPGGGGGDGAGGSQRGGKNSPR